MAKESDQLKSMFNNEKDWKVNMMSQDKVDIVFMYRVLITENDRLREEVKDLEEKIIILKSFNLRPVQGEEDTSRISRKPHKESQ